MSDTSSVSSFRLSDPASGSGSDSDGLSDCGSECQKHEKPKVSSSSFPIIQAEDFYDVLVVGGGPNGLAVCSRLREPNPPSIYTDLEHARLRWLGGSRTKKVKGRQRKLQERGSSRGKEAGPRIAVFDAAGPSWMNTWKNFFDNLNIRSLRSPMFFHPSPHVDSLVGFAQGEKREQELLDLPVVGKGRQDKKRARVAQTKDLINERDRQDYFAPSRKLFNDYIDKELVERYDSGQLVRQGRATDLTWLDGQLHVHGAGLTSGFHVRVQPADPSLPPKEVGAKSVVLAMGPAGTPNIPDFLQPLRTAPNRGHGWCHTSMFAQNPSQLEFPPPEVREKVKQKQALKLLIIGGGLTSAQIAELALKKGFTHVTLLCRSKFKVKYFDLDLEWVSKYGNLEKMKFFQEDDFGERLRMFREAKGGGSVTPQYSKICKDLVKRGLLDIREATSVTQASYAEGWTATVQQHDKEPVAERYDYIVSATGVKMDIDQVPLLQNIRNSHPISTVGGFPILTEDLAWREDLPLFLLGGYSLLQAGPSAFNLVATRENSERIVHGLSQLNLLDSSDEEDPSQWDESVVHGGLFSCLSCDCDN